MKKILTLEPILGFTSVKEKMEKNIIITVRDLRHKGMQGGIGILKQKKGTLKFSVNVQEKKYV